MNIRKKMMVVILQRLRYMYPEAYIIPEGGDNLLGEKGCEEILTQETNYYKNIFCAHGTGTTYEEFQNHYKHIKN
jgi:1-aminocyclopropane-1-carboxylate deaminase